MKNTRTQNLAIAIEKIYKSHKKEISLMSRRGPRGGYNARSISGWVNIGEGAITKAVNMTNCPTMNFWSGSATTPSTAYPKCVEDDVWTKYREIFA